MYLLRSAFAEVACLRVLSDYFGAVQLCNLKNSVVIFLEL
jgi:hypothetical protein